MKKFKGMKKLEQLQKDAIKQGWEVDMTDFEKGSDWFWLRDISNRMLQICVSCFGRFSVYAPVSENPIATEESDWLDDKEWYNEILELLYDPLD